MPIWDREFEFEIKLEGYLLEVIPGWSVTAAGWPVGEKASGFRLQEKRANSLLQTADSSRYAAGMKKCMSD
jgi:hypothetical protein